jgi:outer membrane protein
MRTAFSSLLPLALLAAAVSAQAQAEPKIAVIRTPVLLHDAPQIKAADQKLKGEFAQREKDLQTEGKKLDEDIKKYQREGDTMSAQQRADTEKGLNTRKIDFDFKQRQFQEQAQARNTELRRDVLDKVNAAIEQVAKDKSLDIVVQDPAYASAAMDITDEVLKRLTAMPVDTAPAAAPSGKKKK